MTTLALGSSVAGLATRAPWAALGLAVALLFVPYLAWGVTSPRAPRSLAWAAVLLIPYLLYALGTRTFEWPAFARLGLYVGVPTFLVSLSGERKGPGVFDLLAILALWLPFDLGLLGGIWSWPQPGGARFCQTVLAVDLALFLLVVHRGIDGVGYRFALTRRHVLVVLGNVVLFAVLAIPLGLAIGLAVAAAVFGAAHLDNGGFPNLRYALLATLAGIFYGRAFRQTGNLVPPALVHTFVDSLWGALFR